MEFNKDFTVIMLAAMMGFMMLFKGCDSVNYQSCIPYNSASVDVVKACENILK